MRTPAYMSPTSLKTFEANRDEYYLKYLAETRAPRLPQTRPMSVGSAFDAFVKSYLYYTLNGNYGPGDAYAKDTIFEKQVEPHNRDWAREAGKHVFHTYHQCGALADLMLELGTAVNKPSFEFDLLGTIETHVGDVPVLGKPDIYFINGEGARVILDWKVNGYCAARTTSPMRGYVMVRDGWLPSERKASNGNRMPHKDIVPAIYKGLKINDQDGMEGLDAEWAAQLSTYAWLTGEEIGSQDLIVGIDQITGSGVAANGFPHLRIASHRTKIGAAFQFDLRDRYAAAWHAITTGHIFEGLSPEESKERCEALEAQAAMLNNTDDPMVDFINSTRQQ